MNNEIIVQITSGRGPAECCWVVSQVLKAMIQEAEKSGTGYEVISRTPGQEPGTLVSALIKFSGIGAKINTALFWRRKSWFQRSAKF